MRKRFYIFILGSFCLFSSFSQQVINQNLFGFCTSNTFTYIDIYDSSFVKRVNNFSPYVLRFPGGTIGNFYHPQGEAYGFKVSDVEECYSGRFSNRVNTLKHAAKRMGHHTDYLEDFIALAKTFKSNVIVNANILNSDKVSNNILNNNFKKTNNKSDILISNTLLTNKLDLTDKSNVTISSIDINIKKKNNQNDELSNSKKESISLSDTS